VGVRSLGGGTEFRFYGEGVRSQADFRELHLSPMGIRRAETVVSNGSARETFEEGIRS